ncbi:Holliday junction resolvase RuvX [Falsihalocynthiibacter sp. S25ZX9]|uniref:Putative pre-16S rRNA nuclease n=1 Tax=Falsihalocynthiibacter arcticus TaxID=1579316 RepID=A0A126V1U7_9RHOB|nr:Holliday junction resolvase RuvX [Falsihalocynthiibacter arcticus]AML52302.1 crossover junction endodeoxyribonuclease RuvA [Falsihalocynthiibacter arcticus]
MILELIEEFAPQVPTMRPIAGLDFGDKTIGVALSDRMLNIATPLETIRRKKFTLDAEALLALLAKNEVGGIVLGFPRNMDGSEGPRCQKTRAFARNLERLTPLPITYWDERLSTVAAERALLLADVSRAKRADVIDHVAAGFILQGALDRLSHLRRQ